MNGKQAKRLRKAALGLAAVLSESGKDIKKDGYQEIRTVRHVSRLSTISKDQDEKLVGAVPEYAVQFKVRPDSLKGIYKNIKSGKA